MAENMPPVTIKEERLDEEEIQELARKMAEANKAKMLALQSQKDNSRSKRKKTSDEPSTSASTSTQGGIDEESVKGRFGWTTIGEVHIPYIFRPGYKYCAVRMLEVQLLKKYLRFFHQNIIYNCTDIKSYYITDAEQILLNEINFQHCDSQFGSAMFTKNDLIVRLDDAEEFYNFLSVCYTKLLNKSQSDTDPCGFIRVNGNHVLPYIIHKQQRYIPVFYFEGETSKLDGKAEKIEGWPLSYLKFCCKVQGVKSELFAQNACSVIRFDDIKNYFPPETSFETYWPKEELNLKLLISEKKAQTQSIQWAKTPVVSPKPASQAKAQPSTIQPITIQRKLTSLSDPPAHGNCILYQLHKVVVQEKEISCINRKPYVHTELLVTLPELMSNLFNNLPVESCCQVMSVLGIELYKANKSQMRVLLENGMCQSLDQVVPLVSVRSVMDYMSQLKNMMGDIFENTNTA